MREQDFFALEYLVGHAIEGKPAYYGQMADAYNRAYGARTIARNWGFWAGRASEGLQARTPNTPKLCAILFRKGFDVPGEGYNYRNLSGWQREAQRVFAHDWRDVIRVERLKPRPK